jgi:hypothetical protein
MPGNMFHEDGAKTGSLATADGPTAAVHALTTQRQYFFNAELLRDEMKNPVLRHVAKGDLKNADAQLLMHIRLQSPVAFDRAGCVRALLMEGADAGALTPGTGISALHWASWSRYANIVKLLLSFDAQVDARSEEKGQTAYHWAAIAGDVPCMKLLVEAGVFAIYSSCHMRVCVCIRTHVPLF